MCVSLVAGVSAIGLWWWTTNRTVQGISPSAGTEAASASSPAISAKTDFRGLKGRWLRPDGGYVLEIKNVLEGGRLEATYGNPRPIHVARAEASQDGEATKIFVELRDVNYPGSTYDLVYDLGSDSLHGIYFQAVQQQRFEVIFTRMK